MDKVCIVSHQYYESDIMQGHCFSAQGCAMAGYVTRELYNLIDPEIRRETAASLQIGVQIEWCNKYISSKLLYSIQFRK